MEAWGHFELLLDAYMRKHNISKNFLLRNAQVEYTQLQNYCRGDIQRLDMHVLARICTVLDCTVQDILRFIPPRR